MTTLPILEGDSHFFALTPTDLSLSLKTPTFCRPAAVAKKLGSFCLMRSTGGLFNDHKHTLNLNHPIEVSTCMHVTIFTCIVWKLAKNFLGKYSPFLLSLPVC